MTVLQSAAPSTPRPPPLATSQHVFRLRSDTSEVLKGKRREPQWNPGVPAYRPGRSSLALSHRPDRPGHLGAGSRPQPASPHICRLQNGTLSFIFFLDETFSLISKTSTRAREEITTCFSDQREQQKPRWQQEEERESCWPGQEAPGGSRTEAAQSQR